MTSRPVWISERRVANQCAREGAHPAAWQGPLFRGRLGVACSAAIGTALVALFDPLRVARGAVGH